MATLQDALKVAKSEPDSERSTILLKAIADGKMDSIAQKEGVNLAGIKASLSNDSRFRPASTSLPSSEPPKPVNDIGQFSRTAEESKKLEMDKTYEQQQEQQRKAAPQLSMPSATQATDRVIPLNESKFTEDLRTVPVVGNAVADINVALEGAGSNLESAMNQGGEALGSTYRAANPFNDLTMEQRKEEAGKALNAGAATVADLGTAGMEVAGAFPGAVIKQGTGIFDKGSEMAKSDSIIESAIGRQLQTLGLAPKAIEEGFGAIAQGGQMASDWWKKATGIQEGTREAETSDKLWQLLPQVLIAKGGESMSAGGFGGVKGEYPTIRGGYDSSVYKSPGVLNQLTSKATPILGAAYGKVKGATEELLKPLDTNIMEQPKGVLGEVTPGLLEKAGQKFIGSTVKIDQSKTLEFQKITTKLPEEWLQERGIIDTSENTASQLVDYWHESKKSVDTALSKIEGRFYDKSAERILNDQIAYFEKTSDRPNLTLARRRLNVLQNEGLTLSEMNSVKRLYESTEKLGYTKERNSIGITRATNFDKAIRKYIENKAAERGFTNLAELNRETQAAKFLADQIYRKIGKQRSNNVLGLTDQIMALGGVIEPAAWAALGLKKIIFGETGKSVIAKILSPKKTKGIPEVPTRRIELKSKQARLQSESQPIVQAKPMNSPKNSQPKNPISPTIPPKSSKVKVNKTSPKKQ
jgi:hypothetical protein